MEAKDKAKALVDSFIETMPPLAHQNGFIIMKYAKQCALISCAEAKMVCPYISTENRETREQVESSNIYFLSFWEDVENEINQL